MHKKIVSTAVVALVIGFGAGYFSHSAPAAQNARGTFAGVIGGAGMMRGQGGTNGGGFLTGTVASKDATSITINTRDGSSHVVLISPSTSVSKSVNGSESDIAVGSTIIVSGTTNSGGSISASLIQLRPATSTAMQR